MRSAVVFLWLLVMVAGCTERRRQQGFADTMQSFEGVRIVGVPGASGQLVFETEDDLSRFIEQQVRRLHTVTWELAWLNLRRAGGYAIEPLIASLGDTRQASAPATALPGVVTPGERIFLTRGEVAYALLREIIGEYSDYRGALPAYDKVAWEAWWSANRSSVRITSEVVFRARQ